jgi:hypothetical protein
LPADLRRSRDRDLPATLHADETVVLQPDLTRNVRSICGDICSACASYFHRAYIADRRPEPTSCAPATSLHLSGASPRHDWLCHRGLSAPPTIGLYLRPDFAAICALIVANMSGTI